jgi:hypothetical protein
VNPLTIPGGNIGFTIIQWLALVAPSRVPKTYLRTAWTAVYGWLMEIPIPIAQTTKNGTHNWIGVFTSSVVISPDPTMESPVPKIK